MNDTHFQIDAAISTMWGIGRFANLSDFFDQGSQMGFPRFELNHKVTSQMLAGIKLKSHSIPVVHEPCPADISSQTLKDKDWLISSLDEINRTEGVRARKRSIDLAHKLGSKVVVVHGGHIPGIREMEDRLWALFREGKFRNPEFEEVKDRLIRTRVDRTPPVLEAVRRSLAELAEYARPYGICLGLENRYHLSDFPGLEEMEALLGMLDKESVGFWYDVGHAQTLEHLDFYPHEAWLQKFGSRMFGVHLHDAVGLEDHLPPGEGEVDWDMVASLLPEDILKTLEIHNFNSPQQIIEAVSFLKEKICL